MNADRKTVQQMPSSIVDAQLQRLLEVVDEFQNKQCKELINQARLQSENIIRHTYRSARARLRQHIQEDRRELQQSLASARARQHTFIMQQKHQAGREFLDEAWVLLKEKLLGRWGKTESRKEWIQGAAKVADRTLPAEEWCVEHGKSWSQPDNENLLQIIASSGKTVEFKLDNSIEAGFRIESKGAVVDATVAGLMEDRVRIESEILAQCTQCMIEEEQDGNNSS